MYVFKEASVEDSAMRRTDLDEFATTKLKLERLMDGSLQYNAPQRSRAAQAARGGKSEEKSGKPAQFLMVRLEFPHIAEAPHQSMRVYEETVEHQQPSLDLLSQP